MMRILKILVAGMMLTLIVSSCGVSGDPGHCFISIDWEYYSPDYGVYYYEDNNPDVPASEDIVAGRYYDSYPGIYDYYYEAEDPEYFYEYEGTYELIQNHGTPGGLFHDGLDGADTYVDLYLYIYAKKAAESGGMMVSERDIPTLSDEILPLTGMNSSAPEKLADPSDEILPSTGMNSSAPEKLADRSDMSPRPAIQTNSKRIYQHGDWQITITEKITAYRKNLP